MLSAFIMMLSIVTATFASGLSSTVIAPIQNNIATDAFDVTSDHHLNQQSTMEEFLVPGIVSASVAVNGEKRSRSLVGKNQNAAENANVVMEERRQVQISGALVANNGISRNNTEASRRNTDQCRLILLTDSKASFPKNNGRSNYLIVQQNVV